MVIRCNVVDLGSQEIADLIQRQGTIALNRFISNIGYKPIRGVEMAISHNEVQKQCSFCSGDGKVMIDSFEGGMLSCPFCQSRGELRCTLGQTCIRNSMVAAKSNLMRQCRSRW